MKLNLPYPSDWADFQDLCFRLWKEMWGDPYAHLNGRNGQSQNGVDIWGKSMFEHGYSGVQCKGKNGNYQSKLTTVEIDNECKKAVTFRPNIKSFVMATTSPRDVDIQKYCRNLNEQKLYPFSVDAWAWDDIEDEVQCRPTIMERFYPNVKEASLLHEIQIPIFATVDKFHAFFSRPGLLNNLNPLAINILKDLAYEIAINAFEYGHASTFGIKVENDSVIFTDNGHKFDYSTLLENHGNGGKATMGYAAELFGITYRYETKNILEISLPKNLNFPKDDSKYTINFNANEIYGRVQAEGFVLNELRKLPAGCKKIIVDICGQVNPPISCLFYVIDMLLLKTDGQNIVIYLPDNIYYKKIIIGKYGELQNIDVRFKE
ncbi:hypothetical protein [Phocaeicola coprocola]|uniref:hypothetical protein n=1 Tax=Phocaeicola coprocola TaxID=310298 RepID=UPI002672D877|nr:hypothetical protein [Phocaeicola coprocola]